MLPRNRTLTLLCALTWGCQTSASPSTPTVEVTAAPAASAEPVGSAKRTAKKGPEPCAIPRNYFSCESFGPCEPRGTTTKQRECWVRLYGGIRLDDDRPCWLLYDADLLDQVAAMEADRARRIGLTTPGLAAAEQRHIDAYIEEAAAVRALATAIQFESDASILAKARGRVDAAVASVQREWDNIIAICDPY